MNITTQPQNYIFAKAPTFIYFDKAGADYVVARLFVDGTQVHLYLLNGDRVQINQELKSYLMNRLVFADGKNVQAVSDVYVEFTPFTNGVAGASVNSNSLKALLTTTISNIADYEALKPIGNFGSIVSGQKIYLSFLKLNSVSSLILKAKIIDLQGNASGYSNIETHTSSNTELVSFETTLQAIADVFGGDENSIASVEFMANTSAHRYVLQASSNNIIELNQVRFLNQSGVVQSIALTGEKEDLSKAKNTKYSYEKDGYTYSDVVTEDFQQQIKINSGYKTLAELEELNQMQASTKKQVLINNLWVDFFIEKPKLEYGATNEFINDRNVVLTLKKYSKDAN